MSSINVFSFPILARIMIPNRVAANDISYLLRLVKKDARLHESYNDDLDLVFNWHFATGGFPARFTYPPDTLMAPGIRIHLDDKVVDVLKIVYCPPF